MELQIIITLLRKGVRSRLAELYPNICKCVCVVELKSLQTRVCSDISREVMITIKSNTGLMYSCNNIMIITQYNLTTFKALIENQQDKVAFLLPSVKGKVPI